MRAAIIAIVEPDQNDLFLLERLLREQGHEVICLAHSKGAMALGPNEVDALIMEYDLGSGNPTAADICNLASTWGRWVPCLVHTDHPVHADIASLPQNATFREKGRNFYHVLEFLKQITQ